MATTAGTNFSVGPVSWSTDNNFLEGGYYTAAITLTANPGFTFAGLEHGNATINGLIADIDGTPGRTVTISYIFPAGIYRAITWNLNNGEWVGESQRPTNILDGTILSQPTPNPTRTGHTFMGWFSNAALTTAHNFTNPVTGNLNLYAGWIGISLCTTGTHMFPNATAGFGQQEALTVTITNTGNLPTGQLTATISGANPGSFTLYNATINSIAAGSTNNTLAVRPNTGLAVGTYSAIVTVIGDNNISESFNILFSVGIPSWPVTWNLNNGAWVGDNQGQLFILDNTAITQPTPNPTRTGFTFAGWFSNAGLTIQHNFATPVTNAISLYAGWAGITLSVTGTHTFTNAGFGFGQQEALTVTITNTGNIHTGQLTASLSGTNQGSFTLYNTPIAGIAVGSTGSFNVRPNTGLALGTYTAIVTVFGANNISASFNISFTVTQATVTDYVIPTGLTAIFEQTLAQVTLPSGWAWDNPNALVGAVGQQMHSATYTRSGGFLPVTRNVTITVTQATVTDYVIPTGLTAIFGQTLAQVTLTSGWAWDNPNASVGDVGQQTHSATYTRSGGFLPVTRNVEITVTQATVTDYIIPTGLTAIFGQTLAQITLTSGWAWDNPNASVGAVGQQTHSATYTRSANFLPVTRNVTITVTHATVTDYVIPTGLTAIFEQTLAQVTLPSNWAWDNPNASVGAVGQQMHSATYTRSGGFLPVTRNVPVTVTQATVTDYIIPTGLTAEFGQTLAQVALPANWAWVTPNASVGAVGQQTHSATYTRSANFLPVTRNVTITVTSVWKMVSAGWFHSLAVTTCGQLWAWGSNEYGRTGLNTDTGLTLVPTRVGTASNWASVSAGWWHSHAVTTCGQLWAWGWNGAGATGLGIGTTTATTTPTRVGTASNWAQVSAGREHSLAVTTNGQLWAWGLNDAGRTGLGINDWSTTLVPTRVGTASNWASVSAGDEHSLAVTTNGQLYAWGLNTHGRTGLGISGVGSSTNVPTRVGFASNWASVSAGYIHSHAVTTCGQLWAWGSNANGRTGLGIGTNTTTTTPTRVGNASNWASVSAGASHSLAVTTNGQLWAWGRNEHGRTGLGIDNSWSNTLVPTRVGFASNWASVSAGWEHSHAITTTGQLWAWGWNSSGRTGLGTTTGNTIVPTRVGGN